MKAIKIILIIFTSFITKYSYCQDTSNCILKKSGFHPYLKVDTSYYDFVYNDDTFNLNFEKFKNSDTLCIVIKNETTEHQLLISAFKMTFIFKSKKRANLIDEPSNSDSFTQIMKTVMKMCTPGDVIIIDYIVAKDGNHLDSLESILIRVP